MGYNLKIIAFEFDPDKSERDKKRHGIDFHEAEALWDDPDLIEIPAKTIEDRRFIAIGMIGDTHWSAVITYGSARTRRISVRRSRKEEIGIYEG